MPLAHDLQYAIELARGAGRIILEQYGKVERLTKTHVRRRRMKPSPKPTAPASGISSPGLKKRFPGDGIVGEESETGDSITFDCPNPDGRVWVIDPIDGTNNFIAGLGNFAVCIGLLERGEPVLGVVYDVTRDLVYSAARGEGAWLGTRAPAGRPNPARRQLAAHAHQQPAQQARQTARLGRAVARADQLEDPHPRLGRPRSDSGRRGRRARRRSRSTASSGTSPPPRRSCSKRGDVLPHSQANRFSRSIFENYSGAKVPFVAAAPSAHAELLAGNASESLTVN